MKKYLKYGAIAVAASAFIYAVVSIIVFYATHTCAAWEHVPTGSKCTRNATETHVGVDYEGNMRTYTTIRCVERKACRKCTLMVHEDSAPAEITRPKDRC